MERKAIAKALKLIYAAAGAVAAYDALGEFERSVRGQKRVAQSAFSCRGLS